MQKYSGNVPPKSEGWVELAEFETNGQNWFLFVRSQRNSEDWKTFKVVADGSADGKANYWFLRNISNGKIGLRRDLIAMRKARPELHGVIKGFMRTFYGFDY